ncbi:hypothetical protein [Cellvibrio sp. UBA7661]|mgnify:CR=1 FL=1|uniref:hypothetical protein n=1 Tax=Cellvibrio sp. UBA7661 TaxID=1946311 RepID=UPI002F355CF0
MSLLQRFAQLPAHEQIVYALTAKLAAFAFVLGILWVMLGLGDQSPAADNDWQASVLPKAEDAMGLYVTVAEKPRWFSESGMQQTKPVEDPAKALEGKPESLRLTGLVTKGDTRYALFVPVIASATAIGKPSVLQFKEGDKLVGDWQVTAIEANQVQVRMGDETRTLKMYQPKAN